MEQTRTNIQQSSPKPGSIDYSALKQAYFILWAINQPQRLQIVRLIGERRRINVTDIHVALRLPQSLTSLHLSMLREANIVTAERDAHKMYYSVNLNQIASLAANIDALGFQKDALI